MDNMEDFLNFENMEWKKTTNEPHKFTFTCTTPHGLKEGDTITISGYLDAKGMIVAKEK